MAWLCIRRKDVIMMCKAANPNLTPLRCCAEKGWGRDQRGLNIRLQWSTEQRAQRSQEEEDTLAAGVREVEWRSG